MNNECEIKVKSLGKALRLLELFIDQEELGVTEIAGMLDIQKSNVHDILTTYSAMGYVEQNSTNGKYHLGLQLLKYAYPIVGRMSLYKVLYPHMLILAERFDEISYLGVPNGGEVLYLQIGLPPRKLTDQLIRSLLGEKAPLYCTGIGKAMLCDMQEEEWKERLPKIYKRFTENTICDDEQMMEELRTSHLRGYAIDNEEHVKGQRCVAISIHDSNGHVIAGLSLSGYSQQMTIERCHEIGEYLRGQKELLSMSL